MRYFRQKLLQLVIVVLAVTMLTFILMSLLPGDPAVNIGGVGRTEQEYDQIRAQWNLDKPLPVQYLTWLGNAVTGDFGVSPNFNTKVTELIANRLPVSLYLMAYALLLSMLVAIPMGVYCAYRANSMSDRVLSTVAFGFLSVPNYILGVLLVFLFALRLSWFPALSQYVAPWTSPVEHLKNFFLPVLTLAIGQIAVFMRLLRSDMIMTLQNDFITMARAKGMPTRDILLRHALRPSMFSLITAAAVNVGALIGGTIVVETIFGIPGMGSLTVEAIYRKDFLVVQACVVIFSITFVLINFFVDLLYAAIDPRIRHARALA
jgi:peptide/nickel transport system permease protein